ncbi:MAG: transcription antitermination factor NusB [Acidimicrobiales bacterium]|nr:transcription antitermination factor NusB [Acidimicrobiales bacterium]
MAPEPLVGSRREGREQALGLLYQAELSGQAAAEVVAEQPLPVEPFVSELVCGVGEHQAELDALLDRYARGWTVARMPVVDRLLLRLGCYELLYRPDTPAAAIISEAVELAAQYSTEKSGPFVNGLLARISEERGSEERG